ncbi:hypothetical protein E4T52_11910 [Aureobasidium sp. EXF-3400]|nr:hypothetical protein E4T51_02176 [Aureobasidium sp. EXF-12344]KAI4773105.1 hypothetical protein E4T52_11910 [Aureobasidium sp. EXF-3400]
MDASTTTPDLALSTPLATDQAAATAIVPSLESSPLTLSLESLEAMQSPTKTSILYIRPHDPTNRLQPLCQALRKTFMDAGLLVPDTRPLKLHATIVNTIYIKGRKKNRKPKSEATKEKGEETQATEINLPSSKNTPKDKDVGIQANTPDSGHGPSYVWASDIPISKIAICEMGVKKQLSSTGEVVGEAYKEVATRAI